jgi:Trk K+ transport system NAD-binding subunit
MEFNVTSQFYPLDQFLVCGLGSLGQYCVLALKEFDVSVIAIEQVQPQNWEIAGLSEQLDVLIIGDCRQISILEQAKIRQCRAALIVTTNEQVNIETALTIRQLNPHTRLIVRSAKENLNELLGEQLGNFIAYEPTQLPVNAFALAALGTETLSFFSLDGEKLQVKERQITKNVSWCNNRFLHELNTRHRRILAHAPFNTPLSTDFHQWQPDSPILSGDTLVYLEQVENFYTSPILEEVHPRKLFQRKDQFKHFWHYVTRKLAQLWRINMEQPIRRVTIFCGLIVLLLLIMGTFLLKFSYGKTTLLSAFSATAILLMGGYSDLFGQFEEMDTIPPWLQLYSLVLSLAGTALVGVLYGLVTEALLSSKFQFLKTRPPIPQQDHIVIVGLGRVGQQVAALLQELKQSLVGITFNLNFDRNLLLKMPLIVGNLPESLAQANLDKAKSVVVVTDDEILNLEVALMTKKINHNSHLVIRTLGKELSQSLSKILPHAQVLATYSLVAEVFAGVAFGENILTLFRFNHQTILVTEYMIEANDTLNGLLLAEVAYGYGVVPILYQKYPNSSQLMPSDDLCLAIGDRMIILATIDGLKRIEQGRLKLNLKCWRVKVEKALTSDSVFEGANVISRISGCSLSIARELMNNLPATLTTPLYKYQGMRLVRALKKIRVIAELISIERNI